MQLCEYCHEPFEKKHPLQRFDTLRCKRQAGTKRWLARNKAALEQAKAGKQLPDQPICTNCQADKNNIKVPTTEREFQSAIKMIVYRGLQLGIDFDDLLMAVQAQVQRSQGLRKMVQLD